MKIDKKTWETEQPIGSAFLSNCPDFEIGKQTCVGSSKVTKKGENEGKTMLRFTHENGIPFSMGMGNYKAFCDVAKVSGCDSKGNILDVNSQKISGTYSIAQ